MGFPQEQYEQWSAEATLLVGDATRALLAGKAGFTPFATHVTAMSLVAAAQAIDIKSGAQVIKRLPATFPVGNEAFAGPMFRGIKGISGAGIDIVPAAPGPSVHVVAEGYWMKTG